MKKLLASTALAVTLLISGCAGADAPDSKAAQRLIDMLPAEITLSDFNHTEKIGYFKNKLTGDGAPRGYAPKAGDVCIYVPWGNISVFYEDFRYTNDLVYLGHVEQGLDILSTQQSDFKVNFSIEH